MRIVSDMPVYRAGAQGFTVLEGNEGGIEIRFIPFRLLYKLKNSDSFWPKVIKRTWSRTYRPGEEGYERIKRMYCDDEDFVFEDLNKDQMLNIADIYKKILGYADNKAS